MKKIRYIVMMALGVCAILTGCQELDEAYSNIPIVQTGDATDITATSATLTATVSGNSADGGLIFLISTSEDMSDAYESENVQLRNLTSGTTYYYIAIMRSSDEKHEVRGEMKSFTTLNILTIASMTYTDWDGTIKKLPQSYKVGMTLQDSDGKLYHNQKISNNGTSWSFSTEYAAGRITNIASYWPYTNKDYANDGWGGINVDTYDSYATTDYLVGGITKTENNGSKVNINLKHATPRVIFHFSVAEDHTIIKGFITRLNIGCGDKVLPIAGFIDLESAFITGHTFEPYQNDSSIELNKGEVSDYTFYPLPTYSAGSVTLSLHGSAGINYQFDVQKEMEIDWKAGQTYEYEILLEESSITVTNVTVEDWTNNEGGDITVND